MNAGHPSAPVAVLLLTWVWNHGIAPCKAETTAGHRDHMYKYRLCSPSRQCRRPYVRWRVLETPQIFPPLQQQKNFVSSCSGNVFFFFKAEVYYSKLTEEKLLSRQSIEFKRRTMGHLAHSEKCTMPAPSLPISVLRIRHLQLPLTFRWMSTLPEEPWLKAEFGSAGSLSANPPSHSARSLLHPPLNHLLKYKLCVLAHPVVHKGHSEYRFCVLKIIVPFLFCATHLRSIYKRCRFKKKTLQPAELIYNAIEAIKKISCLILLKIRCGRERERVEILHYNESMSYLQGHQIVFVLQSSTNTSNLMQKY